MKLVFYMRQGLPHPKNWQAIQRMCASHSIEFEYTNLIERIEYPDYDILYCMSQFVDPHIIPPSIKVFYGPQLWVIPEPPMVGPYQPCLTNRCVFNLLSKWVVDYYYEMAKECIMPIAEFPLSVHTDAFKPYDPPLPKDTDCIVYVKRRSHSLVKKALALLLQKGLQYKFFKYGSYKEEEYKTSLHRTKFMLVLDAHESQGFALEEAMSCNVPLLVMDATSMYDEMNEDNQSSTYKHLRPKKLVATSVPYWSDICGIKIQSVDDLSDAMDTMMNTYSQYEPRKYILETLSDSVCMKRMLDYFGLHEHEQPPSNST